MSDCCVCVQCEYRGFRRDGWPTAVYLYCGEFGHNRPPDCTLFEEGEPRYFDNHGVEMTREELDAIPDPMKEES